jgi:hypothetical protein
MIWYLLDLILFLLWIAYAILFVLFYVLTGWPMALFAAGVGFTNAGWQAGMSLRRFLE